MLVNTQAIVPQLYQILTAFEQSQFEFFLTGSRFFGGADLDSDYDFFVAKSDSLESWLRELGFVTDQDVAYTDDPTFSTVLILNTVEGVIQVQLIEENQLARKELVQRLLFKRYGRRGLPGDKNAKRELWHMAYLIVSELAIA